MAILNRELYEPYKTPQNPLLRELDPAHAGKKGKVFLLRTVMKNSFLTDQLVQVVYSYTNGTSTVISMDTNQKFLCLTKNLYQM